MPTIGFPLLLIPLAIYNIFVFLMPDVALSAPFATVHLLSGAGWPVTFGDVLIALGLVLLLFEVAKGARPGAKYLTDHLLSLLVCAAAIAEFLWLVPFGTSTFFLLTLLSAVDFLAGTSIALRQRRYLRAYQQPAAGPSGRPAEHIPHGPSDTLREPAPRPMPEPRFDRAPAAAPPPSEPRPPAGNPPPAPSHQDRSPEAAQVPPVTQIFPAEHAPPDKTALRDVGEWSVSDLVSDASADSAKSGDPAKNMAVPAVPPPATKPEN